MTFSCAVSGIVGTGATSYLESAEHVTQQNVSDQLSMDKMMVSDVVKTLEKRNLLTRKPQPEDGRAMSLHLTASAREKLKKAVPAVESADEEFLKKLNTKNRERFIECLIELNPNMS